MKCQLYYLIVLFLELVDRSKHIMIANDYDCVFMFADSADDWRLYMLPFVRRDVDKITRECRHKSPPEEPTVVVEWNLLNKHNDVC